MYLDNIKLSAKNEKEIENPNTGDIGFTLKIQWWSFA